MDINFKMKDYKYEIQTLAEDLADEKYNKSFNCLNSEQRAEIFKQAERDWADQQAAYGDYLREIFNDRIS